jgi:hypothetical protein
LEVRFVLINEQVHINGNCIKNRIFFFFYAYLKKYPLKSIKKERVRLIPMFFELRALRAYDHSKESLTYKNWVLFERRWFRYNPCFALQTETK